MCSQDILTCSTLFPPQSDLRCLYYRNRVNHSKDHYKVPPSCLPERQGALHGADKHLAPNKGNLSLQARLLTMTQLTQEKQRDLAIEMAESLVLEVEALTSPRWILPHCCNSDQCPCRLSRVGTGVASEQLLRGTLSS